MGWLSRVSLSKPFHGAVLYELDRQPVGRGTDLVQPTRSFNAVGEGPDRLHRRRVPRAAASIVISHGLC